MADIEVARPSQEDIEKMGVPSWPIWEKEASEFPWHYSDQETCYLLEGEVEVTTSEGVTKFGAGDLVVFPTDLDCTWKIIKPVRKHYKFGP